jgi:hypothetical protein
MMDEKQDACMYGFSLLPMHVSYPASFVLIVRSGLERVLCTLSPTVLHAHYYLLHCRLSGSRLLGLRGKDR